MHALISQISTVSGQGLITLLLCMQWCRDNDWRAKRALTGEFNGKVCIVVHARMKLAMNVCMWERFWSWGDCSHVRRERWD